MSDVLDPKLQARQTTSTTSQIMTADDPLYQGPPGVREMPQAGPESQPARVYTPDEGPVRHPEIRMTADNPTYVGPRAVARQANISTLLSELGDEAEDVRARVGASIALSERLGIPAREVFNDFDHWAEQFMGRPTAPQGVFDAIGNSYRRAQIMYDVGMLRARQMTGDSSAEIQQQIDILKSQLPPEDQTDRHWTLQALTRTGEWTAQILPHMIRGMAASAPAAAAGAVAGMPFGPAMATLGATVAGTGTLFTHSAASMAGLAYDSLLEMRDDNGNGLDPRAAYGAAIAIGALGGALEVVGVARLPGVDELLQRTLGIAVRRSLLSDRMSSTLGRFGARVLQGAVEETSVEVTQEVIGIVGEEWAKAITNNNRATGFEFDPTEALQRITQTAVQSFVGMGIVSLPGATWTAARTYRSARAAGAGETAGTTEAPTIQMTPAQQATAIEDEVRAFAEAEREALSLLETDPQAYAARVIELESQWNDLQRRRTAVSQTTPATQVKAPWEMTQAEFDAQGAEATAQADQRVTAQRSAATQRWISQIQERIGASPKTAEATVVLADIAAQQMGLSVDEFLQAEFGERIFATSEQTSQRLEDVWITEFMRRDPSLTRDQARTRAVQHVKGEAAIYDSAASIIHLAERADVSTVIHEMGHVIRRRLAPELQLDAAELYGAQNGQWTLEQEEAFASDWEKYWLRGVAPSARHETVFARLAAMIRQVYAHIKTAFDLSPEKVLLFDMIVDRADQEITPQKLAADGVVIPSDATGNPITEAINNVRNEIRERVQATAAQVNAEIDAEFGPSEGRRQSRYETREVPVARLKLSEDVGQFKEGADPTTGVVEGLEADSYERLGTAPIVVWERLSGDLEIITGRHRADLARRLGEETIPAQVVREADGFTADDAKRLDVESNIRDGQGSIDDFVRYFEGNDLSDEQARSRGLLSREAGRKGYTIGRYSGEALRTLYRSGQISAAKATAIASGAPGNDAAQRAAIAQQRTAHADMLHEIAKIAATVETTDATQQDMFGADDSAMQAMVRMAATAASANRVLKDEIAVLRKARALSGSQARDILSRTLGEAVALADGPDQQRAISERMDVLDRASIIMSDWTTTPELAQWIREGAQGENPAIAMAEAMQARQRDADDTPGLFHMADQTDSEAFRAWFGDSKVVDENGQPLVVYHVTNERFDAFDPYAAAMGGMFWFTADRGKIDAAETGASLHPDKPRVVLDVYLSAAKLAGWNEYDKFSVGELERMGYDGIKLDDDYVVFRPEQIKSVDNRGTWDPNDARILFQETAWHGSPHMFDRFSLEAIGTGEGAQAFGWGLYFSEREGVARAYANELTSRPQRTVDADPDILRGLNQDSARRYDELTEIAKNRDLTADEEYQFTRYQERALEGRTIALLVREVEQHIRDHGEDFADAVELAVSYALQTELAREDDVVRFRQYINEGLITPVELPSRRNLYRVRLASGREAKWLDWVGRAPNDLLEAIAVQFPQDWQALEESSRFWGFDPWDQTGEAIYRWLNDELESPRAASEWLSGQGVTGIKYPVNGTTRNDYTGGSNYVVFRDADIEVEEHILFQFAGSEAATLSEERSAALSLAQQLEENGAAPQDIRRDTGWFRGRYDGKWRFEIPTDQMKWRASSLERFNGTLAAALDAPALFEAYPVLRNLRVRLRMAYDAPARGSMSLPQSLFGLPDDLQSDITTGALEVYAQAATPSALRTILMHELQHVIQELEGFAKGASLTDGGRRFSASEEIDATLGHQRARKAYDDFMRTAPADWKDAAQVYLNNQVDNRAEYRELYGEAMLEAADQGEWDAMLVMDERSAAHTSEFFQRRADLAHARSLARQATNVDRYLLSAGEIEARDIEARSQMWPEDRAATEPYSSADADGILDDQAIVLFQEDWGPDLTEDVGEGRLTAAIETLLERKTGYVRNAVTHPVLGPITIPYGSKGQGRKGKNGFGLAHMLHRRSLKGIDAETFIRRDLPTLLKHGVPFSKLLRNGDYQPHRDRAYLRVENNEAVIRLDWNGDDHAWVVTAFPRRDDVNVTAWGSGVSGTSDGNPATNVDVSSIIQPYTPADNVLLQTDLAAFHGITAEKLYQALELGGMPMPSIAIRPAEMGYSDFGDITLIGDRDMIDPERGNEVYTGDAYTPRFPDVEWRADRNAIRTMVLDLGEIEQEYDALKDARGRPAYTGDLETYATTPKRLFDRLWGHVGAQIMWMRDEKGLEIDLPIETRETPVDRVEYETRVRRWIGERKEAGVPVSEFPFAEWERAQGLEPIEMRTESELDTIAFREQFAPLVDEYQAWLRKWSAGFFSDPQVRAGRKKVPMTLRAVVEAMSRGRSVGGENVGNFYSASAARAEMSRRFTSVEDIRQASDRVLPNDEARAAWEETVVPAVNSYLEVAGPEYKWASETRITDFLPDSHRALGAYLKGGFKKRSESRMATALGRHDIKATPELVAAALDAAHAIAEAPVKYFEAKPSRAVWMNEWRAAVVPASLDDELKQGLREAGIALYEYADDSDRAAVMQQAFEDQPALLFQEDGKPSHASIVQNAVEQYQPVPDRVLAEYASEEWAIDEISRRAEMLEEARDWDSEDEFAEYVTAADPSLPIKYVRHIYSQRQPWTRRDLARKWLSTLSSEELTVYLIEAARRDEIGELDNGVVEAAARKLRDGGTLDGSDVSNVLAAIGHDADRYRELFAEWSEEDGSAIGAVGIVSGERLRSRTGEELDADRQALQAAREEIGARRLDLDGVERELDEKNAALRAAGEELAKLAEQVRAAEQQGTENVQTIAAQDEALRSARAESRQNAAAVRRQMNERLAAARERTASVRREVRALYEYRAKVQKQIRRIMAKPSAAIDYQFAKQILEIQRGVSAGKNEFLSRHTDRLQNVMRDLPDGDIKKILGEELKRVDLKKMNPVELDALEAQVEELRQKGRAARAVKLAERTQRRAQMISEIVESITNGESLEQFEQLSSRETKEELKKGRINVALLNSLRPERLWRLMDGGSPGALYKALWTEINRTTDEELRRVDERISAGEAKMKELGIKTKRLGELVTIDGHSHTIDEIIHMYIAMQDPQSAAALEHGNKIPRSTIARYLENLSREEKMWGDWMIDSFGEENFERIQTVLIDVENRGMEKVTRYFPLLRRDWVATDFADEVADSILRTSWSGRVGVDKKFTLRRQEISDRNQRAIALGATRIWRDQVAKQEKYIATAQQLSDLRSVFGSRVTTQAIVQEFGQPAKQMIDKFINDWTNPNLYRASGDFARMMQMFRNHYSVAVLSYNAITILKQVPSSMLYMAEVGPVHYLAAWGKFMANPARTIREIEAMDPQVKARSMNQFQEELKQLDATTYQRIVQKVGTVGFWGIGAMDKIAVAVGWKAVYDGAKARGLSEAEAIAAAQNATLRTQPAARAKDLAALYRTEAGLKWFLMFSNQLNQIFNMVAADLPMAVRNKQIGAAFGIIASISLNALAMGVIARKRLWDDDKEPEERATQAGLDILTQLTAAVPLVGSGLTAGATGFFGGGVDPFPFAYEAGALARALSNGEIDMRDINQVIRLIEAGGTAAGLPTVAARRLRQTFLDDDFDWQVDLWELIGGAPEDGE